LSRPGRCCAFPGFSAAADETWGTLFVLLFQFSGQILPQPQRRFVGMTTILPSSS
jgi:hypothetical protein